MGNFPGPDEFGSRDPELGQEPAPPIERPEAVSIFNGLIDVMGGGFMGQKQAMKEFQRQYAVWLG